MSESQEVITESTQTTGQIVMSKLYANKVLVAMTVVLLILIIGCLMFKSGKKEGYRSQQVRDDEQSKWSVEKALGDFLEHQEKMIQKIKLAENDIDDAF